MTSGKQKGSAFERDVCKALSRWVSGGEKEDLFWRSAMSGGRATVGRKKGQEHARHAGDISATSPEGHVLTDKWYVECKFYKDLAIQSALLKGIGKLASFWREACEQATHYKRMPMLIAKENMSPCIVLMPTAHLITPYGTAHYPAAMLGRMSILRADVLSFEGMLKLPFKDRLSSADQPFLHPGELARILGQQVKPHNADMGRIKEKVRSMTDAELLRMPGVGIKTLNRIRAKTDKPKIKRERL